MRNNFDILNLSRQFDFLYISCFHPDVDFDVTRFDNLFDCVRIELIRRQDQTQKLRMVNICLNTLILILFSGHLKIIKIKLNH